MGQGGVGARVRPVGGGLSSPNPREIRVEAKWLGQKVTCLVDTGATTSLVSADWWRRHGQEDRLQVAPQKVTTADGGEIVVLGQCIDSLRVDDKDYCARFIVAEIEEEAIVGMDFLVEHQVLIDAATQRLKFEAPASQRILLARALVVAAGEEVEVDGLVDQAVAPAVAVVEGIREVEDRCGVRICRALVTPEEGVVPVRLFNPGQEPLILRDGMTLAKLEAVAEGGVPEEGSTEKEVSAPERCRRLVGQAAHVMVEQLISTADVQDKALLRDELLKYADAFATEPGELGRTSLVQHEINTGDARPVKQPPRRLAPHRRPVVAKEVEEMLKKGVVEPCNGPWASPVVLVRKKDGTQRFCVDFRRLNSVTIKDAYPLPRIDDSLDSLAGAAWFSTLDLASGYWQVEVAEKDRDKTAFATHLGLYRFVAMPFGLCNAPGTFERLMEVVLRGLQFEYCLVYLDDIVVFAPTEAEHARRLGMVLERLRDAGLKLKPSKCHIGKREVQFLGHLISALGIATDPDKVRAVAECPVPRNVTDVRSFLGLVGYYRQFIPDFARVSRPLAQLGEKNRTFVWSPECAEAFDALRLALQQAPILGYPREHGRLILDTDASDFGLGAVLSQEQDGAERVLAYASRSLQKPERRYCTTRKELLAVIFGLKKFRHYLLGRHFLVRTDHASLRWIASFRDPEGQMARWIQRLDSFDYEIMHRPGKKHGNADGLSRLPCGQCKREGCPAPAGTGEAPGALGSAEGAATCNRVATRSTDDPALARWVQAQQEDPVLSRVRTWVEEVSPPQDVAGEGYAVKAYAAQMPRLAMAGGLLVRRWVPPVGPERRQVCVPDTLREEALGACHGGGLPGHFGVTRSIRRCQENHYWPNYRRDVTLYVGRCEACLRRKSPPTRARAPMGHVAVGLPMERWAVDIMGPLPKSHSNNKYIVVFMDYYTKWAEAAPMANQEAQTVARAFIQLVVCRFGAPAVLHSDQGRNFQSNLFREVLKQLGVTQTRTCAFRPQSDGMVERANRTIKEMLATVVAKDQRDWDTLLPLVMAAYRSSRQESTGATPNLMVLGREVASPYQLAYPEEGARPPDDELGYVAQLQRDLEDAHEYARRHLGVAVTRQRRNHDPAAEARPYEEGEVVYYFHDVKKVGLTPKLMCRWEGPFKVVLRLSHTVYVLEDEKKKRKIAHFNQLKPGPRAPGAEQVRRVRVVTHRATPAGPGAWTGPGRGDVMSDAGLGTRPGTVPSVASTTAPGAHRPSEMGKATKKKVKLSPRQREQRERRERERLAAPTGGLDPPWRPGRLETSPPRPGLRGRLGPELTALQRRLGPAPVVQEGQMDDTSSPSPPPRLRSVVQVPRPVYGPTPGSGRENVPPRAPKAPRKRRAKRRRSGAPPSVEGSRQKGVAPPGREPMQLTTRSRPGRSANQRASRTKLRRDQRRRKRAREDLATAQFVVVSTLSDEEAADLLNTSEEEAIGLLDTTESESEIRVMADQCAPEVWQKCQQCGSTFAKFVSRERHEASDHQRGFIVECPADDGCPGWIETWRWGDLLKQHVAAHHPNGHPYTNADGSIKPEWTKKRAMQRLTKIWCHPLPGKTEKYDPAVHKLAGDQTRTLRQRLAAEAAAEAEGARTEDDESDSDSDGSGDPGTGAPLKVEAPPEAGEPSRKRRRLDEDELGEPGLQTPSGSPHAERSAAALVEESESAETPAGELVETPEMKPRRSPSADSAQTPDTKPPRSSSADSTRSGGKRRSSSADSAPSPSPSTLAGRGGKQGPGARRPPRFNRFGPDETEGTETSEVDDGDTSGGSEARTRNRSPSGGAGTVAARQAPAEAGLLYTLPSPRQGRRIPLGPRRAGDYVVAIPPELLMAMVARHQADQVMYINGYFDEKRPVVMTYDASDVTGLTPRPGENAIDSVLAPDAQQRASQEWAARLGGARFLESLGARDQTHVRNNILGLTVGVPPPLSGSPPQRGVSTADTLAHLRRLYAGHQAPTPTADLERLAGREVAIVASPPASGSDSAPLSCAPPDAVCGVGGEARRPAPGQRKTYAETGTQTCPGLWASRLVRRPKEDVPRTWREVLNLPVKDEIDLEPDSLASSAPVGPPPRWMLNHFRAPPDGSEFRLCDTVEARDQARLTADGRYRVDRVRSLVAELVPEDTPRAPPRQFGGSSTRGVAEASTTDGECQTDFQPPEDALARLRLDPDTNQLEKEAPPKTSEGKEKEEDRS